MPSASRFQRAFSWLFVVVSCLSLTVPSLADERPEAEEWVHVPIPKVAKGGLPPVVPGFPNTSQTPGAILSGLNAPQQGRTAILAYHNGLLYTVPEVPSSQPGADFQVRTWDLQDPTDPQIVDVHGTTPMPINAHGYFKSGDYLILGSNWPPEAPWSFRRTAAGGTERTEFPDLLCAGARGCLFGPWFIDTWWSYDDVEGNARLQRNWQVQAEWDHLGLTGVVGHPFILGDLLIYASDQSRTGVATYDISDPTNPVLLDVLTTGGPGGYWPELWGGDGKLYVVFPYRSNGNGMRVVDATDPSDLQFLADTSLPGDESMYIQFQDEFAFMGSHKVDMRTFQSVLDLDGQNTVRPNDGGTGINTSQFLLPLGNLLVTGGIGSNEGMAIWAHQAAPDTRGPSVGFHIPQAGRTNYPLDAPISVLIHETLETFTIVNGVSFIVRPVGGAPISGDLIYAFNDILTFTPDAPLAADTTYEVVFPEDGIKDAVGNGMVGYAYTFSTGGAVNGNRPPQVNSFGASSYPVAPGANVTLTASAMDPDTEPVEYRFDAGDGSPKTAWSGSASTVHSYAEPGHYKATVQARDAAGSLASSTATVTVWTPPVGPRPERSTPIVCDDSGRRVFRVNPDQNTLTAIHADSLQVLFEVPVCRDPRSVALTAAGELWVSCFDGDAISVLTASGHPVTEIELGWGSGPTGLTVSPDGGTAFVALESRGELWRYDTGSRSRTGTLALGPSPRALAVSGDGAHVYVTRFLSARSYGEVWEVNASSMLVDRTFKLRKYGGDDNRDGTAGGRGVPNYLAGITLSPDGQYAWVAATKANTDRGLYFHEDLDSDNSVRNILIQLDLATGEPAATLDLDNSESVTALAFSPLGDYFFATLQGNNEVVAFDALVAGTFQGLGGFVTRNSVGAAPQGLCVDASTQRTFVHNFMGRSISALETVDLFEAGSKSFASAEVNAIAAENLSPQVLQGKRIFYHGGDERMSAEGYLSCATCHLDGAQDGRVWDFTGRGEGFRNTTTLRGKGGTAQGNVHWTANFDEIQDFENDIRGPFGGSGFMTDGDFAATSDPLGMPKAGLSASLDALAAYVASLGRDTLPKSPFRQADGSMTVQGEAGRQVFNAEGCATCHAGPGMTDSTVGSPTLHDVGTLRTSSGSRLAQPLTGIDTPTLLGVWNTAPYFHDGSAETLEDVFRVAGGANIEAETGSVSGGASIVDNYVDLNNDSSVHGLSFVELGTTVGARLTLSHVDGGSGGQGALEFRFSNAGATEVDVTVNGSTQRINLPSVGNSPGWRHVNWRSVRVENVNWNAGSNNTVRFTSTRTWPNVSLDDVVVTTSDDEAAARPHRRVAALSQTDQDALLAFLRQLDTSSESVGALPIFADGFESGSVEAWSSSMP